MRACARREIASIPDAFIGTTGGEGVEAIRTAFGLQRVSP